MPRPTVDFERVNLHDERGVTSPPLTEMSLEARIKTLRRNLMSFQIFKESRREFIVGSAKASAVVAGAVLAPMAFASSLSAPLVAGIAATLGTMTAAANTDLLHALGTRIGLEIAAEIGGEGADAVPLALSYADNAGPAIDPLQAGIAHAMVLACGAEGAACIETSAPYSSVLGVALISNPATGRIARVEIFPEALSHLTMIQEATASASLQKQAVMSASADAFYRVTYPA